MNLISEYLLAVVMANKVRTRNDSGESKMATYLGIGKDLLPTELPTLWAILRLGLPGGKGDDG